MRTESRQKGTTLSVSCNRDCTEFTPTSAGGKGISHKTYSSSRKQEKAEEEEPVRDTPPGETRERQTACCVAHKQKNDSEQKCPNALRKTHHAVTRTSTASWVLTHHYRLVHTFHTFTADRLTYLVSLCQNYSKSFNNSDANSFLQGVCFFYSLASISILQYKPVVAGLDGVSWPICPVVNDECFWVRQTQNK